MDEKVQLHLLLSLLSLPPRFTFSTCLLNLSLQSVNTNRSPAETMEWINMESMICLWLALSL